MRATKLLGALLTAAAFCITTDANAADHLAPCTDVLKEYHARVETLIRQAAPDGTLWKVTVFPSFQAEWGIRATRLGDDYELTVVRFDRSIWDAGWVKTRRNEMKHDPSIARARPRAITHKISARLFSELESEIRRSIEAARSHDEIILDGVTFRFEVAESGCGETQTLDRETRAGKLVASSLRSAIHRARTRYSACWMNSSTERRARIARILSESPASKPRLLESQHGLAEVTLDGYRKIFDGVWRPGRMSHLQPKTGLVLRTRPFGGQYAMGWAIH